MKYKKAIVVSFVLMVSFAISTKYNFDIQHEIINERFSGEIGGLEVFPSVLPPEPYHSLFLLSLFLSILFGAILVGSVFKLLYFVKVNGL